ncbi:MAG TPA: hypothetical protein VMM84_02695 [Pyrinomonadaceae bacterium]|nr:hypothetical protein [Pyrinomonadaceae bacterium]
MRRNQTLMVSVLIMLTTGVPSVQATTIVVVRTANEIVIGADSKVTDAAGTDTGRQVCKILQAGNLFVGLEGFFRNPDTGFNLDQVVSKALRLRPAAPATERVAILTGQLTQYLFSELLYIKEKTPRVFERRFVGRPFLRIVVAGFEAGKPLVFVREFRAAQITPQTLGITVVQDDCLANCQSEVVTKILGEKEAINGLAEEAPDFWQDGLAAGVRRLLEIAIASRSEYVGPPVDILSITRGSARWIQRKQECANINIRELRRRPQSRRE